MQLTTVEIRYDREGISLGQAVITFAKLSDAKKAIENFHGRTLDGTPMQVSECLHVSQSYGSCAREFDVRNSAPVYASVSCITSGPA